MKKLIASIAFILLFTSYSLPAYATICNKAIGNCTVQTESPKTYINNVLSSIFSLFFIVGILYFLWHGVFAGLHLIQSEGDPKKFEMAKEELTWGFGGLAVIFSVFALLKVVGLIFGIKGLDTLQIQWPTI